MISNGMPTITGKLPEVDASIYAGPFGEFILGSSAVLLNYTEEELTKSEKYYSSLLRDDQNDLRLLFTPQNTFDVSITRLLPYLTWRHEQAHFHALTSTPTGLFLWKLLKVIMQAIFYLLHSVERRGGSMIDISDILDCYENIRRGKSRLGWTEAEISCALEVVSCSMLYSSIVGSPSISRQKFIENFCLAQKLVSIRTEMPEDYLVQGKLTDHSAPMAIKSMLSGVEILELISLSEEIGCLSRVSASPKSFQEWKKLRIINPKYSNAFKAYESNFCDPLAASAAGVLSMFGFISISANHQSNGKISELSDRATSPDDLIVQNHPSYIFSSIADLSHSDFIDRSGKEIWSFLPLGEYGRAFEKRNERLASGGIWGKDFTGNAVRNAIREAGGRIDKNTYRVLRPSGQMEKYTYSNFSRSAVSRKMFGSKFDFKLAGSSGSYVTFCTDAIMSSEPDTSKEKAQRFLSSVLLDFARTRFVASFLSGACVFSSVDIESILNRHFNGTGLTLRMLLNGSLSDKYFDKYIAL